MPQVDLNDFAAGLEHVVHDRSDLRSVHPMKGLTEGDDTKESKLARELLGPHTNAGGIVYIGFLSGTPDLGDHSRVRVQADHLFEEVSE